jgi:hypothetical protein
MVLLPRSLAALSDHDAEIQASLKYRAYELYGWYPEGADIPVKPAFYPTNWREPEPLPLRATRRSPVIRGEPKETDKLDLMSSEELAVVIRRLQEWSRKPQLNVHRIIAIVNRCREGIARDELIAQVGRVATTKNAYGAIASLLTSKGNAYGRVFEDVDGIIRLHPMVEEYVRSLPWS